VNVIIRNNKKYIEGIPSKQLMQTAGDILLLLEECANNDADLVMLYQENLPPRFFDLKTGEAGEILQKLRNYHIKMAVILTGEIAVTGRFAEMVTEEKRGRDFAVFNDKQEAEKWLLGLSE
jgi:hypothetical protein